MPYLFPSKLEDATFNVNGVFESALLRARNPPRYGPVQRASEASNKVNILQSRAVVKTIRTKRLEDQKIKCKLS